MPKKGLIMAKDALQILIQTIVDQQKEESRLNKQLKKFKLDPLTLKAQIDVTSLQKQLKKLKLSVNVYATNLNNATKAALSGDTKALITGIEQKSAALAKLSNRLLNIQQQAYNLSKPIQQGDYLDKLNQQYQDIDNAITKIGQSDKAVSREQIRNINNMITESERLRKQYQKQEYTSVKLAPVSLSEQIEKTSASFTTNEKRWEKAGILTGDFKSKVDELKSSLSSLNSEGDIQHFSNRFAVLSESARRLTMDVPVKSFRQFNTEVQKIIATNTMQKYLNENTIAAKAYSGAFDSLKVKLSKISNPDDLRSWKNEFRSLTTTISATGQTGVNVLEKLTKNASKFAQWLLTSGGVMLGIIALKDVVTNVVELDKSIVSLQMATGENYEKTSMLLDSYIQMGKELGASTVEVANSADVFLRQGKSIEDTNKLIRASMILSKVSSMDSAESTQALTSIMLGYKLSVEDVIGVVDKLTSVDLISATTASGLAIALRYVSTNAALAGVELDKMLSYIAVVSETTQKASETVGTSFNTILSRMSSIKLGRLTDPETEEDISGVETVLRNLGIKLRDSNTEFRDFGDVLDEVGGKWNSYSSVQKRAIAVAFAGVRNQENLLVLFENYNKTLQYTEVAANSSGMALEKFEIYQQGVEAHTKKLTAAFEELSRTMLNTDDVKGFLDIGAGILETLTAIIEKAGLIPTIIGSISAALSLSGKNGGMFTPINSSGIDIKAINVIKEYNNLLGGSEAKQITFKTSLMETNKPLATYLNGLGSAKASFTGYISSLTGAKLSTIGLTVASTALNIALTMGIALAIQGLIVWVSNLVQAQEKARQSAIESSQTYKDEAATLKNYKTQISELRDELIKGNITQEESANKRSELMKIQDDIINKYGQEAEGIDLVTGSLKEQLGIIDEITRQKAESWQAENYSVIKDAQDYLNKTRSQGASYQAGTESPLDDYIRNQVSSLGGKTNDIISSGRGYSAKIGTQIDFKGTYDEIIAFYDKLATSINNYAKEMGIDSNAIVESLLSGMSDTISKIKNDPKYKDYTSLVSEDVLRTAEAAYTFHYNKLLETRGKYNDAVAVGDEKLIAKSYESLQIVKDSALKAVSYDTNYAEELTDLINQTADVQAKATQNIQNANNDAAASIKYTAEQIEEQKKTVDSLYNSLEDLESIMGQVQEGQEYSTVQIVDIISKYPEIIGHIEQTANGYKIQETALDGLMKKEIEELKVKARLTTEMAKANFIANGGSVNAINKYSADISSGAITDFSKYSSDIYVAGLSDWMAAKAQEIAYDKFLSEVANNGLLPGFTPEKTKANKEDLYKKDVESKISDLQYLHDMGKISEAEYLNELDTLNNKYYKNLAKYKEESRRLDVEIYKGRNQLAEEAAKDEEKRAEEAKKQAEEVLKIQQDAIQRRIDKAGELFEIHQNENIYIEQLQKLLRYINVSEQQRLEILNKISDVRKNEYKDIINDLEFTNELLARETGTEQKRIDNLRKMQKVIDAETERLKLLGYDSNSNELQSLKRSWLQYEDEVKGILQDLNDKITQNLKDSLQSQSEMLQSHIDGLQEQQSDLESAIGYVNSVISEQIQKLEDEKSALQANNEQISKQIELTKLQDALLNARNNKNVRVYHADKGWVFEADQRAVSEAEQNLSEWYRAENLRQEIENIDSRITAWQAYKDQWNSVTKEVETQNSKILAEQIYGAGIESDILNQRASAVEEFSRRYKQVLVDIASAQSELNSINQQIQNVDSGGSSIGGSGKIAPIAYSKDRDYQAEINAILLQMQNATPEEKKSSSYANYMERLRSLETQRNSKIVQEKLPYEQTSLYGGQAFANGTLDSGSTGQFSVVGENGSEITYVPARTTIFTAEMSKNLWKQGLNPVQTTLDNIKQIPNLSSVINNNKSTSSQTHYHFGDISLPHVNDIQTFISELRIWANVHNPR